MTSKNKIKLAVGLFAAAVIITASWKHGEAAAAAVVAAFTLIGALVCDAAGVCAQLGGING